MMLMQPKKMASIIVSSHKPDYVDNVGETKTSNVESDDSIGIEAAADSILSAIQAKDSKKLVQSLKNFFYLCEESEDESEEGL